MESHESVRAVLRLRTLAPYGINGTQETVIDRLKGLVESGSLSDLDVDAWGASVRTTENDVTAVRETVSEFVEWADRNGCSLTPAFEWREDNSFLDEEHGQGSVVVLPLLCLAVYDGETLKAVYPHRDGEAVCTIHDGIEALEALPEPTASVDEAAIRTGDGRLTLPEHGT